ncbi:hypothetical protein [Microbacterium oxydans]|uniref:Low molecular weight protein-tyrosine-phosphatase YwlE n=1 Tax=Microbacterium oxydans TaxID=82380 RepID=A0A0F0LD97_9MICO|nr:hypothetical protein [Microbacterium oxydans]KJL29531.1 Low molecular weight protein-tyrosine-phosphatase YwlE [Microbacterium oxydans]
MTGRVLFVCAQNICRSPLMAAAFEDELGADASRWVVGSAGTEASPGRRACRYSVEVVVTALGHLSTPLTMADLDAADLVIAASLAERSLIVRKSPSARSRTFTLREALLLGEQQVSAASLAEYADVLDSRRGTLDLPTQRSLPWRRETGHPLDVVDVHHLGIRTHRRGLQKAAADTRTLARRLQQGIAPRS